MDCWGVRGPPSDGSGGGSGGGGGATARDRGRGAGRDGEGTAEPAVYRHLSALHTELCHEAEQQVSCVVFSILSYPSLSPPLLFPPFPSLPSSPSPLSSSLTLSPPPPPPLLSPALTGFQPACPGSSPLLVTMATTWTQSCSREQWSMASSSANTTT